MLQSLEKRRLYAGASVVFTSEHSLVVYGGTDAASIRVFRDADHIVVDLVNQDRSRTVQEFVSASVRRISIITGAGDDSIVLGKITQPTDISTGGGNDSVFGSLGNDAVNLGTGNDRFYGRGGSDSIKGGVGNDAIYSGWDESEAYVIQRPTGDSISVSRRIAKRDEGSDWLDAGSGNDYSALAAFPIGVRNAERYAFESYEPIKIAPQGAWAEFGPHGVYAWREDGEDFLGVAAMWSDGGQHARFGNVIREGNTFYIDGTAFRWRGGATQALQASQRTYAVGELSRGPYRVVVQQDGQTVFRHDFEVTGSKWSGQAMPDSALGHHVRPDT